MSSLEGLRDRRVVSTAKSTFVAASVLLPLIYLFALFSGANRRVTLSVSVPVIALILALTLIGTGLLLHNFFHSSPDRPFLSVVVACFAGVTCFAIAHEIAKIAVPYAHGASAVAMATVVRSGDGHQLYGRSQLFDHCALYLDVTLHDGSSHRLCIRSTIDAYRPLIDSPPRDGEALRISTETNGLGTYAVRIIVDRGTQ